MCISAQLCDAQGTALFPFFRLPPRLCCPFAGAPVHDMSLTHGERLRVVVCALTGTLVRLLSLGVGCSSTTTTTAPTPITGTFTATTATTTITTHFLPHFEPQRNRRACHKLMHFMVGRVVAKLMHSLAAAVGSKAGKEAEELCASGQCAAAAVALKRAMDVGHLPSRALKAWMLILGREGVAQDENAAFGLVEEGARLGCHHCQGVMSECYFDGHGCEEDEERSLELARESTGKGSRYGQFVLGGVYHCGIGGVAQDYAQALALYRLAAAQNFDSAQNDLGCMYDNGLGVAQDLTEALRWYQLAAAQGHTAALFNVAECHERGRGVRKNKAEAIRWYGRANAAGHPGAADALQRLRA
jgi:TPR repeat protein